MLVAFNRFRAAFETTRSQPKTALLPLNGTHAHKPYVAQKSHSSLEAPCCPESTHRFDPFVLHSKSSVHPKPYAFGLRRPALPVMRSTSMHQTSVISNSRSIAPPISCFSEGMYFMHNATSKRMYVTNHPARTTLRARLSARHAAPTRERREPSYARSYVTNPTRPRLRPNHAQPINMAPSSSKRDEFPFVKNEYLRSAYCIG